MVIVETPRKNTSRRYDAITRRLRCYDEAYTTSDDGDEATRSRRGSVIVEDTPKEYTDAARDYAETTMLRRQLRRRVDGRGEEIAGGEEGHREHPERNQPTARRHCADDYDAYDDSYNDEWMNGDEDNSAGAEEVVIVEDTPEEYQPDCYADDYADDYDAYDDSYDEEDYAQDEVVAETDENVAVVEDDFSYEFDDYEMYYGYEPDELSGMEEAAGEEQTTTPAAVEKDFGSSASQSDWEVYSHEDEYDYAEPTDDYGRGYEEMDWFQGIDQPADPPKSVPDLFSWEPSELLDADDWNLMRTLESLYRDPSAVRRATLNDYIESLGFEAIDFAYRFEDATDSDVLELADDLASVAALLACYRLVERGEIDMDEAVGLLEGALRTDAIG